MTSNIEIANRLMKVLKDPETYRDDLDLSGYYFDDQDYPSHIIDFSNFSKDKNRLNQIVVFIEDGIFFVRCELMNEFEIIDIQNKEIDQETVLNILIWYLERNIFPSSSGGYWSCKKYGIDDSVMEMIEREV